MLLHIVYAVHECHPSGYSMHVRSLSQLLEVGCSWRPSPRPTMDTSQPWRRKVEPECPPWMEESVERLEKKRAEYMTANQKRQLAIADEPAGASSSSGLHESLPPPVDWHEDMKRFRHASMTPASFAPTRHLYMCCGRPMVVLWLMSSRGSTEPVGHMGVVKTKRQYALGDARVFRFRTHATSRAYCLLFHIAYIQLPPWGLPALLTLILNRCSS